MNPDRWQQVTRLFHAALDREPHERTTFLEEACRGDRALREEVDSLLVSHSGAEGFISRPAFEADLGLDDPHQAELMERGRLGPYSIESVLGHGGMGVVYLAEDTRLNRRVALKALPPEFARDPTRRERLRQEARAAAALSHPAIATVYALEEIEEDLYIVFEYVRGETLRVELESGRLSLENLITTTSQIASALAAAHAAGIVHRDLKPENAIRCPDGSIKILDFGLARFQSPLQMTGSSPTRLTSVGLVMGTPAYMSPEQIAGHDADFRTDIFAFGVLTYELASGVHPFEGTTPTTTAAHIVESEPIPLSERVPTLPTGLDRIVRKCLRKKREERYQSTLDLLVDIEHLRRDTSEPVALTSTREPSGASRVPSALEASWWRVHQLVVMSVYAVMASVVWIVRGSIGGVLAQAVFVGVVVAAAINGTLRAHLLFTYRFNKKALVAEMRNTAPWRSGSDAGVATMLFVTSILTAPTHGAIAALLAAVAVGCVVGFLVIEPATTRAAFSQRPSGARPKPRI